MDKIKMPLAENIQNSAMKRSIRISYTQFV